MRVLHLLVNSIDRFTEACGRLLAWLVLAMALLTTSVVVLRYGFSIGSIMAQEAIIYLHGCVFMLGAGYALKHDSHVRVDIFYRRLSRRGQAWVNSLGGVLLLLPLCGFILLISRDYVTASWIIRESSPEPGGIPAVFLLKTLLPLLALNLLLQGLAETLRNVALLIREGS
ncbi:C4-dicarboxylate ABC transporter permease [Kineobactrum sediminis]|uniref:TRAP transporter small permease protein n=1 Tax=Kineobactrum sediminis TaxID=1905677 RepID=A0A2N5Y4Z7_9GAMM|nr:TRAP transporter small permease subunit [Kineobactrum sediminis]PLW83467.1 C4-dicarboxylate ABC transporter permease [Kineobactrum sediminis]